MVAPLYTECNGARTKGPVPPFRINTRDEWIWKLTKETVVFSKTLVIGVTYDGGLNQPTLMIILMTAPEYSEPLSSVFPFPGVVI